MDSENNREQAATRAYQYTLGKYAGGPTKPDDTEALHKGIIEDIKSRSFDERKFEGRDYKQGQGVRYRYGE